MQMDADWGGWIDLWMDVYLSGMDQNIRRMTVRQHNHIRMVRMRRMRMRRMRMRMVSYDDALFDRRRRRRRKQRTFDDFQRRRASRRHQATLHNPQSHPARSPAPRLVLILAVVAVHVIRQVVHLHLIGRRRRRFQRITVAAAHRLFFCLILIHLILITLHQLDIHSQSNPKLKYSNRLPRWHPPIPPDRTTCAFWAESNFQIPPSGGARTATTTCNWNHWKMSQ